MASITLTCTIQKINAMKLYYNDSLITSPPYAVFAAKTKNARITAYQSGKVVFQGNGSDIEAKKWGEEKQENATHSSYDFSSLNIIGSDEVGNGSYFGPLVVVATYVSKEQLPFLKQLHVRDSKTMSDQEMKKIYHAIQGKIKYKVMMVKPATYNRIQPQYNAVHMKAVLHNQALALLEQEIKQQHLPLDGIIVDAFTSKKNYLSYTQKEKNKTTAPLYFKTKGEGYHLAVALASIIARVLFLKELQAEEESLQMKLPIGANATVDQVASNIIQQKGKEALTSVAKLHFANTKKAEALAYKKRN